MRYTQDKIEVPGAGASSFWAVISAAVFLYRCYASQDFSAQENPAVYQTFGKTSERNVKRRR